MLILCIFKIIVVHGGSKITNSDTYVINSVRNAKIRQEYETGTLGWFTYPLQPEVFMKDYFELKPVLLNRRLPGYYEEKTPTKRKRKEVQGRPLDELFHYIQESAYDKKCHRLVKSDGFPYIRATNNGKDVKPFLYWKMPEIKRGYDKATVMKEQSKYKQNQVSQISCSSLIV